MTPETIRTMQQAGVRRLCVISGEAGWCQQTAAEWIAKLTGDWLCISESPLFPTPHCSPGALRTLLGREFLHAVFDARQGLHAEAFAALAGTLKAGSWLLLLVPEWQTWPQKPDADSLRWADVAEPIATPHFIHHLQRRIEADDRVLLHRQHHALNVEPLAPLPDWHCQAPQQQQTILSALHTMHRGVAVINAARGRGKSALAGMLAQQNGRCLITAPAKASTEVLAAFAGENFNFMAPDAIIQQAAAANVDWLIIDEAAAIPAPLLQTLVKRYPRVLLTTTVQGYEGTGRGFMLKFCAGLPQVSYFTLDEPLRWSRADPLEEWLNQALMFEDALPAPTCGDRSVRQLDSNSGDNPVPIEAAYRLLTSAHYRTSPLDLRRLLDAPGMHLWLAGDAPALQGALWLVEEGGLSSELAHAVWAGWRRPRGNLVAQSLAAHGGFTDAATLRSLRISRIAVAAECRRQGLGLTLINAARASAQCDYLSVSFGYTESLWAFWRACGFTLVRIGSQREASSGCYAAMAMCAITPAGKDLQDAAAHQLARDWPVLRQHIHLDLDCFPLSEGAYIAQDAWLAAGFAWAQRPFDASLPVLTRLLSVTPFPAPLLRAAVAAPAELSLLAREAGLSGRKTLIAALRQQAAEALLAHNQEYAEALRRQL